MADKQIKEKIHQVLKNGYFNSPNDLVDVSDGSYDYIHLVIVSRKFDGQRIKDRYELIWDELGNNLVPEEWGQISLTIGASPEEVKAI